MDLLTFVTLVVVGFTACSEFGSFALVHPVIRRLPPADHIRVEQGLLATFGRLMPLLMPLSSVLGVVFAAVADADAADRAVRWAAAACLLASVATTLVVNLPINLATGRWDPENPPSDWKAVRDRWERYQAVRTWLLLVGFVLVCAAASLDS